jgi:hypothetical protein
MPKDAKLKAADRDDRLGEQQQAEEQESPRELDSEEVDWEEVDWEEIEKEIETYPSDYPELCPKAREYVRTEATLQRMRRFSSEGKWEEFNKELEGLPAQEKRKFNKELKNKATREFHFLAIKQVLESTGQGEKRGGALSTMVLYRHLNPQDGVESALVRVIVALTDTTMECVRRASTSDALPVRELELNYAMKGAVVLAALTKAFDNHRYPKKTK